MNLPEVLRVSTATVRKLTDSDAVHISLPEPDSAQFRVYALDFPEGKGLVKEEMLIEPVGIARKALEELKPLVRTITHAEE